MQPFEEVVAAHGATVLRVCRAVVGPDDADDAWSETFLSALRAWPDLPADADVVAWLVTIAHRRSVDLLRARGRRAVPSATLPDRPVPPVEPDGVDVWSRVAALPERQRLCVAYHYLGGLPWAQVAQVVGGTPQAARRAGADGVRRLRRELVPTDGGAR